jgi:hypothetical protein
LVAPRNFNAPPINNGIHLTWNKPSSDEYSPINGYYIYRGNSSGMESLAYTPGIEMV